jgi:hypothetical protein
VGKASSPASFAEAQGGASGKGPPHGHQRHRMDPAHRGETCRERTATVYSRFRSWQEAGIWQKLWETLQRLADAEGDLD